jgi:SPFH domain/Band 7 family protein
MFFFVVGLVFVMAAIIVLLIPSSTFAEKGATGAGLLLIAILAFAVSTVTIVGTKKVGVVTTFNKPVDTMSNGIHLKAPWQKVTELDGAIQTDNHTGGSVEKPNGCTLVRIGNQSTACVDNTIRWRIRQHAADALFRDYRSFDHIRDSLVTRDLIVALNDVFATYNPLGNLNSNVTTAPPSLEALSAQVRELLVGKNGTSGRIGNQIEVLSVFTPIIHHDNQTQRKINQYQAAKADTRIALQKVKTAVNEAKANKTLAGSVSNDPNVLVSKCLDLVRTGVALPAGFTCWPGGSSAVVVPSQNRR